MLWCASQWWCFFRVLVGELSTFSQPLLLFLLLLLHFSCPSISISCPPPPSHPCPRRSLLQPWAKPTCRLPVVAWQVPSPEDLTSSTSIVWEVFSKSLNWENYFAVKYLLDVIKGFLNTFLDLFYFLYLT